MPIEDNINQDIANIMEDIADYDAAGNADDMEAQAQAVKNRRLHEDQLVLDRIEQNKEDSAESGPTLAAEEVAEYETDITEDLDSLQ